MSLRKFYLYLLRTPLGPRNVLDCFWYDCASLARKCGVSRLEIFLLRQGEENAARAALLYDVSPPEYAGARRRPGPPHWRRDLAVELGVVLAAVVVGWAVASLILRR